MIEDWESDFQNTRIFEKIISKKVDNKKKKKEKRAERMHLM